MIPKVMCTAGLALGVGMTLLSGPLGAQCRSERFSSSDNFNGDDFGHQVAAQDDHLFVGARRAEPAGARSGAVYQFVQTPTGYQEVAKLVSPEGAIGDEFGYDLALDGEWLAVSSPYRNRPAGSSWGAVYVFRETTPGSWTFHSKLEGSLTVAGGDFGEDLDLQDGLVPRIVIGANWHPTEATFNAGAVYSFEYDSGADTWVEAQIVTSSDATVGDSFGRSVALDGGRLVVGAPFHDGFTTGGGAVYVFQDSGTEFVETVKLDVPGMTTSSQIGTRVEVQGDLLVIINPGTFVYEYDSGSGAWVYKTELLNPATTARFVGNVSIEYPRIAVGDIGEGLGGSVQFFEDVGGTWAWQSETSGVSFGDAYGYAVKLLGNRVIVGARDANVGSSSGWTAGEVYVEELGGIDCNANGTPDACDLFAGTSIDANANGVPDECECQAVNYCTSAPNSTGSAAVISLVGSTSVATNSFTLTAGPLPNNFGIFYYGPNQVDSAFGNGRRCVGGQVFRLPIQMSSGNTLSLAYDLTLPPQAAGQITAGSVWNFQAWFRDPAAGSAGFDLSDGLSVSFCP